MMEYTVRTFKPVFLIPLMVLLLLASETNCITAQTQSNGAGEINNPTPGKLPQGIEVLVEAGLGGVYHLGRVNPVTVLIANRNSESIFSCTVEVLCEVDTYSCDMNIAAGDVLANTFFVDLDPPPGSLIVNVKSHTGKSLLLRKLDLKQAASAEDAVALVVTDQPGILSYIDQTPVLTRSQAYLGNRTNAYQPGKVFVTYLSLDSLLGMGTRCLAAADILVIQSGDFSRITDKDLASLEAFTAAGGLLVTSAGIDAKKLCESPLSDMLPMNTNSAEPSSEILALSDFADVRMNSTVTAIVASGGSIRNDASVLAGSDAVPLIVERKYGFGKLVQMNFDFSQPQIRSWQGWTKLWRKIIVPSLASPNMETRMFLPGSVLDSLSRIPQTEAIPLQLATLFIIIYIVLVGPVNYAVLARRKKRTLLWVSIPLVVVAFSLFSVMLGYFWRGTTNIIRTIDEVHHFEGVPVAVACNYTMYFAAASGRETVTANVVNPIFRTFVPPLVDQDVYWYSPAPRENEKKASRVTYSPEATLYRHMNKWTPYVLWLDYIDDANSGLVSYKGGVTPSAKYRFDAPVQDSWLYLNANPVSLGRLDKDGEVSLNGVAGYTDRTKTIKGSISKIRGAIVASLPERKSVGTNSIYTLITYSDRAGDRKNFTRRYTNDAATFDFYHMLRNDWTVANPNIDIAIVDFNTSRKTHTSQGTGYGYNYGYNNGLLSVSKDDSVVFNARIDPLDINKKYKFKISATLVYDWQSNGTLEYDVKFTGNGYNDTQAGVTNEQLEALIKGSAFADGGLTITINPKSTLTINSIEIAPEP